MGNETYHLKRDKDFLYVLMLFHIIKQMIRNLGATHGVHLMGLMQKHT